jgi:hypothetical protein
MSKTNLPAWRQSCIGALPWPAIYGSGEFHLGKSFADVDCKCFQLAGPIFSRGSVRVIVGDYVRGEVYAIAALKKHKYRLPPPAACGLMSAHSSAPMPAGENFNFLQGLTSPEVDVILAAEGIQCTRDQAQFINVIGVSQNAFFPAKAAPGSSKTTFAEGIVRASIPKLKEHQKIIWLLKTRQQRDKQLRRLRNARGISVQVAVVGRAADEIKDDEENDVFLDAALQLEANQQLLHFGEALRELKNQLSAYTGPSDVNTPDGRVWKAQSENMHRIVVARYAAKLQIWEDVLRKINVFCRTVDCFLQIQSDASMLSKVFAPWDIALAICDEAHQVDLQSAFVVRLRAQTVCMFGDQPQHIELYRWGNQLASEHIAPPSESYCWQKWYLHGCSGMSAR